MGTYVENVRKQAKAMNVHNALRTTQEKGGEKYRTYTILKALCKLKEAGIGYRNNDDIVIDENNATATEMLKFIVGKSYDFGKIDDENPLKMYQKLNKLPITLQELEDNLPIYLGELPADAKMKKERKRITKKKWFNPKTTQGRRLGDVNTKGMSPSELVLHRRRLADAARMEENDVDAMSPSQLALHRRRLTHGARVSPVLAALMDEIEQAQRNY